MPTTQKLQQKQTKATQKVGGSAKKPVTKAMEGGSAKKPAVTKAMEGGKVAPSKGKMTRGGSAKGGGFKIYQETKERSEDNRQLILLLYKLINEIVNKFNSESELAYSFSLEKISDDREVSDNLNPLIDKLNSNDKEYIRSIKKIRLLRKYVKKEQSEYLDSYYLLTKADEAQGISLGANIILLRNNPKYRNSVLYDGIVPNN